MKITIQRLLEKPVAIPPGWLIFNAPRPLSGTLTADGQMVWVGEFRHGIYYAAVNPAPEDCGPALIKLNVELDGWLCQYVTEPDIEDWGRAYCAEYGIDYAEQDFRDIQRSYFNQMGQEVLEMTPAALISFGQTKP